MTDSDGLALRIQKSGVKSWVLRVFQNGRIVDITLGHWPELSLMQARATARRKKKELELEPSGSYTVRDAFKFWCSKKKGRIISYRDEKLRLEKYVISKIGSRQLDTITLPIVVSQIEALATPKYKVLFYFSLATLLRPGEVVSIRLEWINEEAITIPAEFMKMKRVHRIPLTPYLIAIIKEAKANRKNKRSPYLFPGTKPNKHISGQALAKWLHSQPEFKNRLVAHGLRSIGRTWFADNDVPLEVAEACLAHVTGSQVVRAYQRGDYFASRSKILLGWHAYIQTCARCAQVLSQNPDKSSDPA